VIGYTLLGGLLPGSGLIAAGRRVLGWLILGSCLLAAAAGVGLLAVGDPLQLTTQLVTHPERLTVLALVLIGLTVLWALHLIGTTVSLRRFAELTGLQSALSWVLVLVLAVGGVGTAVASTQRTLLLGRDTLSAIFSGGTGSQKKPDSSKDNPWADIPRVNVLLIGSDAGADRTGIRTDTLMVASVDTKTGETVLFSLPRNLERVPFPTGSRQAQDYPEGFACPTHECMINALWQFGVEHQDQYYKGDPNPGMTATVQGVHEALGLDIDYTAMVDLRGFMQFVDAIGGLTINVTRRIPIGGHRTAAGYQVGVTDYIEPGVQKLDGYQSLWFARSRSDSDDFERMRRQRCVIGALAQQADPQTIALHITDILRAAKDNIRTTIPLADLDAWVTLAMRIKKAHVRSLPFTDRVIAPGNPDFNKIHRLVQDTLTAPPTTDQTTSAGTPTPTVTATPSASGKHGTPSASGSASPSATEPVDQAVDVNAVC
jgi:LCP family protein required for cell wall assembly